MQIGDITTEKNNREEKRKMKEIEDKKMLNGNNVDVDKVSAYYHPVELYFISLLDLYIFNMNVTHIKLLLYKIRSNTIYKQYLTNICLMQN